jgi:hypothetical protein
MPQTSGRLFDELGKLLTDAAGAADDGWLAPPPAYASKLQLRLGRRRVNRATAGRAADDGTSIPEPQPVEPQTTEPQRL